MLAVAEQKLAEGYSKRKVAAELGIDESTLRKRLKPGAGVTSLGRNKPVFTVDQKIELSTHCRYLDARSYGLTLQTLCKLGFDYAVSNGIIHPFDKATKMAGKDWAYRFIQTHNLALRIPQKTSLGRIMGFNKNQVKVFFENLSLFYDKYKFPPSAIFNMYEIGLPTVPNKISKVITDKARSYASCIFVPPAIIFARKRTRSGLLDGAPPEIIAMCYDSGYVNSGLFLQCIHHFQEKVRADNDHPALLLLDNHSSHLSLEAYDSMASPLTRETSRDFDINKPGCSGSIRTTPVSPREIIPFPKRSELTKRNIRSKHSEIISGSPYNHRLLQDLKEKENKITAKKERSKKRLDLKKGDGNQVKSTKQSHQIQCLGCEEMYVDPPNEDWIQCTSCEAWWHENCSAYEDTPNFVCDLCHHMNCDMRREAGESGGVAVRQVPLAELRAGRRLSVCARDEWRRHSGPAGRR
ncbi:hypothetical protein PR048_003148 [Dryococelus australis]|uniref:DDE-1 domain-containing protein n=1 Tax=Dryococelus australis TaxID=614101 RepID=A0ABQ9IM65_9NEOP|nr:hypothetical protein PR048_003148 [Dryococelus australis]